MMDDMGCEYKQDEFEECFNEIDIDHNNYIEKKEMAKFITTLIGLDK
eukprot:CAMPEP_0176343898 /NCGR_PEP_ID=MMETSP0126-20121128/4275_1 /TAXON_ID=141414 ORGANISM="Strombidinopsis acuminatum, Strain SPMC142" /NCGR_SAMPLE_ID=MMETSP0126 /ASSEMBLY_ACC=CAM_ASM_000229 /LENGTH=46 /DNA_ID= /DNA_START= /DNA_END= /DNA_ORIENTATION=